MYEKHIKVAPKSLSVDYVLRKDPSPHLKLGGLLYDLLPLVGHDSTDPQVGRRSNTRECNIQLAVTENWGRQVDTSSLQSLPLRLVDCHCKSRSNWELNTLHHKRVILLICKEGNTGDEDAAPFFVYRPYALLREILDKVPVGCSNVINIVGWQLKLDITLTHCNRRWIGQDCGAA